MVGLSLGVDMNSSQIEIIYRHPNLTASGTVRFMSFPISNEQEMNTMFSIALPFPNMVHLYVTVSMIDSAINLNVEPKYVEEYVDVDPKSDAPPVCHEEEMVATNEYTEFRTETDDDTRRNLVFNVGWKK
ncbi:hypothetical protein E5676_scaffold487G00290 [Cucumis melo var. makuwa]|uniref:Uncharacterized protein n=2 Tax=Cucumis melo TaxID=3656 RepID=A0A5D3BFY6_CUCMM|nr:hypothetical protein [Cucumis melo subsp. melo]KAA0037868.1 hypothetical protein E6C27_scaffold36G00320 [Cucumis melo var. makuwa]TYJ98006.1 hypothetical protein E5676_scaffold487G00290 [Cucumis melo var. makuwa]